MAVGRAVAVGAGSGVDVSVGGNVGGSGVLVAGSVVAVAVGETGVWVGKLVATSLIKAGVGNATSSPEQAATSSKSTHKLKKRKAFMVSILFCL